METKYIITFPTGRAVAGYNDAGILVFWQVEKELSDTEYKAVYTGMLPVREEAVRSLNQRTKGKVVVSKMVEDTSFEAFWNGYDYKVGKKDRAIKLWNALTHSEKVLALQGVKKYNRWIAGRSIEKSYPETFLSQRRWENEFK